jgi:raffinose/stachyose/melibiose transport system permease protein
MPFKIKRELPYLAFTIPAILAYTLFTIIPLLMSFRYSFTNWDGYNRADFVGLNNYIGMFKDKAMTTAMINTLIYGFFSPFLITLFAIPLSLILNSGMRTRNLQRAIFFFPSVPSALILGYVWTYILSPTESGALNMILSVVGIKPIYWTADAKLAMVSLLILAVWGWSGWHACIYLANLQSIPQELYESGKIDGAGGWNKFRYITFPMLAPAMTISVMLNITGSLKVFDMPYALTGGGPGYATTMITQMIIKRGVSDKLYGKATAMSVLFFLVIFIITFIQLNLMKKREEKLQ